jgi:hypothetical protein
MIRRGKGFELNDLQLLKLLKVAFSKSILFKVKSFQEMRLPS